MTNAMANRALHAAQRTAGITRRLGLHGLRHAYATHLFESGVEIRRLQIILGHADIRTTQVYVQVLRQVPNPLDLLPKPTK